MKLKTSVEESIWKTENTLEHSQKECIASEELLNTEASIDATRAVLATQAYQEHADKPLLVKRAFMLKNILVYADLISCRHCSLVIRLRKTGQHLSSRNMRWIGL